LICNVNPVLRRCHVEQRHPGSNPGSPVVLVTSPPSRLVRQVAVSFASVFRTLRTEGHPGHTPTIGTNGTNRDQGRLGRASSGHASAFGTEVSGRQVNSLAPDSPFSSGECAWPKPRQSLACLAKASPKPQSLMRMDVSQNARVAEVSSYAPTGRWPDSRQFRRRKT
jgi:hypothetical protein